MYAEDQQVAHSDQSTALPMRAHTILGVCEAIGEDFGFNATWLRVPFAATVLVSPLYAILAYLALGVLVLGSRLIFPRAKLATSTSQVVKVAVPANSQAEQQLAA
ncbi:MAG: PspC domain-containing protein [Sphingomicrobium sp.]